MAGEENVRIEGFLDAVDAKTLDDYAGLPGTKVREQAEFDAMKEYVLWLYGGVEVTHSFLDRNDQVFDCIPIEQQPSLRESSKSPAEPPPENPFADKRQEGENLTLIEPQLGERRTDRLGNPMKCPPGTLAMRRVTLEELTRFERLRDFFRKAPGGPGGHPSVTAEAGAGEHKYAHAQQIVPNLGGHSFLNIWQPALPAQRGFSLSQHWYAGFDPLQTVECGWQVYPQKYGNVLPCLFIYWTPDGYQTGSYNLDCSAFVQTNPVWLLGGALQPVSTHGGTQYCIGLSTYFNEGKWWIYLRDATGEAPLGYYPASLYGSGPLASGAQVVDFGGEVVNGDSGTPFPQMGSGEFAARGWRNAAYHSAVSYIPRGGGSATPSLMPDQPSPGCFTVQVDTSGGAPRIYFGGPGGGPCP